jgi:hypothetical protein
MENTTGQRGRFLKNTVTNVRKFKQLTETLEENVLAKGQRIGSYEEGETQLIQKKMLKEDTKYFYRNLARRIQ